VVQEIVYQDGMGRTCIFRRMIVQGNQYIAGNKKRKFICQPFLFRQHGLKCGLGYYRAFPVFVIFLEGLMGDGGFVWAGSSWP
jgi:hypothetical protein